MEATSSTPNQNSRPLRQKRRNPESGFMGSHLKTSQAEYTDTDTYTYTYTYTYESLLRTSRQVPANTPTFPSPTIDIGSAHAPKYHDLLNPRSHKSPALSLPPPQVSSRPPRLNTPATYPYVAPPVRDWPSRDPIGERGGFNLYGMVGNEAVGRWDVLGLEWVVGDRKLALDTVHKGGMEAHRAAETEYLAKVKNQTQKVTAYDTPEGEKYKPSAPREYGGLLCEKCDIDDSGLKKHSYYLTSTKGIWPKKGANAEVLPQAADKCNKGDKRVGYWHTHPSVLFEEKMGRTVKTTSYQYHWRGGQSFSGTRGSNQGDRGFVRSQRWNKGNQPLFVTYRKGSSKFKWKYNTDMMFSAGVLSTVRSSDEMEAEILTLEGGGKFEGFK